MTWQLPSRLGKRDRLHEDRVIIREGGDRRHRCLDVGEVGGKLGVFAIAHGVIGGTGSVEFLGDPEWRSCFLPAINLPSVVQHVDPRVWRRRQYQFRWRQGRNKYVSLQPYC